MLFVLFGCTRVLDAFGVHVYYMPSSSMEPTISLNDRFMAVRQQHYVDGDIVVFQPPTTSPNPFVKRIVAVAGDRLRIKDGTLYRNGRAVSEPYIAQRTDYELDVKNYGIFTNGIELDRATSDVPPRRDWQAADRVPDGYCFVLGDNRNNSEDSHFFGFVKVSAILGRVQNIVHVKS